MASKREKESGGDGRQRGSAREESRGTNNGRFPGRSSESKSEFDTRLAGLLEACRKNLGSFDPSLVSKAFHLCYDAHRHSLRASGEPYYTHPVEVAHILVREISLDDVSVAAALLHDVVEDTEYTLDDIRAEFGDVVAEIVDVQV